MGNAPADNYKRQMVDLIREYKRLNFDDRKKRFTEFIKREADIFAGCIDVAKIKNISHYDFDNMMNERNHYLRELFDTKDVCIVF